MKIIKLHMQGFPHQAFCEARKGDVWILFIHGLNYPPERRANPPRVRLLEDAKLGHTEAELLDEWPEAPEYWPPESAPRPPKKTNRSADQGRDAKTA